jgi:osmotically-inducible protein OsmY
MNPPSQSVRATLLSLVAAALIPFAAFAQTDTVDVTAAFILGGAVIEDLKVVQISDIILIRGKTNDKKKAIAASLIATTLGYHRVANLIVIRDDAQDDAAIVYTGQRRLELEAQLEGCRFRVDSKLGVIRLTGSVHNDLQSDLAVAILARIDGVKAIHPDLTRR